MQTSFYILNNRWCKNYNKELQFEGWQSNALHAIVWLRKHSFDLVFSTLVECPPNWKLEEKFGELQIWPVNISVNWVFEDSRSRSIKWTHILFAFVLKNNITIYSQFVRAKPRFEQRDALYLKLYCEKDYLVVLIFTEYI